MPALDRGTRPGKPLKTRSMRAFVRRFEEMMEPSAEVLSPTRGFLALSSSGMALRLFFEG